MSYREIHPQFKETFEYFPGIPIEIQEALWNYLAYGFEPGGFMTSVLHNDFIGASCRSHPALTTESFRDIAKWILNYMPLESYGNKKTMERWKAKSNEERRDIMIELRLRPGEFEILAGIAIR